MVCTVLALASIGAVDAQQRPPAVRDHRVTQRSELVLQPATVEPISLSKLNISVVGDRRVLKSNSISNHKTGRFPGRGNPNEISVQNINVSLPMRPLKNRQPGFYQLGTFGISMNGVIFEPQAAEWYRGRRGSPWQYDALGGALPLGFDEHMAHVQPNGTYHYHGLPKGLLGRLHLHSNEHSPIIGWAMDGFPIYALYGTDETGKVFKVRSGYRLKKGYRTTEDNGPGGKYDGAFVADYVHVSNEGTLDQCNGRYVVNADFPKGTYAYFLTDTFPIIPRCFYGTPVAQAFSKPRVGSARPASGRGEYKGDREAQIRKAAKELGISVQTLRRALGPPPPNFAAAARKLGISQDRLRRLLGPR